MDGSAGTTVMALPNDCETPSGHSGNTTGSATSPLVVHVLEAFEGGTRRHLTEIVGALEGSGLRQHVVVATLRDASVRDDVARFRSAGHGVTILQMRRVPSVDEAATLMRLRQICRRLVPRLVVLHSSRAGFIGRVALWRDAVPLLYAPHGFAFACCGNKLYGTLYCAIERVLARRTTLLLAVSNAEGRLAIASGLIQPSHLRVIENAVDAAAVRTVIRVGPLRPPGHRLFGLLGELRPQKNVTTLLRALRIVRCWRTPLRCLLPDQGPMARKTRRLVSAWGLQSLVEFVDTRAGLDPILERIDVGVLPSVGEGLPYSLLDALALGRPVVTSDIAVFGDIVARVDRSLLARTDSPLSLARRLHVWALAPTERLASAGDRGRALVAERHDFGTWQESVRDLFRSLARVPGGQSAPRANDRSGAK